ncbi:terminal repeat-encoded protein [Staphylococcus phage phiSA12]|uniref:Terminal repeat-encoded protein n=1 Tax=Staphylococcus phage phiSA12 TaxID=1450142 RepID=W0TV76_9CAUD|nr:terminal repeat-encoded protein [Staphylococcus phage phiSA12]BAO47245.1 terminal repeat-encoded protein [Staphylococcus phage phiSA12]
MDNLTYTVYHKDSDKVVATGLDEKDLLNLIGRMVYKKVVKGIFLPDYVKSQVPEFIVDTDRLIVDIESQDVFYFRHTWHVG